MGSSACSVCQTAWLSKSGSWPRFRRGRDEARPAAEQRSGVEAMVALHLRKRCGDVEEILAPLRGEVTEGEA
jgi:hypothetical protein